MYRSKALRRQGRIQGRGTSWPLHPKNVPRKLFRRVDFFFESRHPEGPECERQEDHFQDLCGRRGFAG